MFVQRPFHYKRFKTKQETILLCKKEKINIENKELKTLLNLIPELTLARDGILLKSKQNCHTERFATSYRVSA